MSFLSSFFLLGLPLLAVPVAIHLISRRRQEVVKWAAMQFLMDSNIRRRKIWRLDDLILMLLRTFAILGIVLALARPLWHGAGAGDGLGRDVVFVWDVSMSMEREPDSVSSSFDQMMEKTRELLAQLGSRDTVRGSVTIGRGKWLDSEPHSASPDHKEYLLNELKKVGVTQTSADWIACLGTALRVASPRDAKAKFVVMMSDGQAQGWRQQDPAGWQNLVRQSDESPIPVEIELYNVIGTVPVVHNLAIDKMTTPRQLVGIGETIVVDAEVRNYGQTQMPQASVNWSLDDVSIGKSTCGPIAPGQSRQVALKHIITKSGLNQLTCRVDSRDNLPSDNERTLIIESIESVPILLVDDTTERDPLKSDKGFLLAALGNDPSGEVSSRNTSLFRVKTITPKDLEQHPLSDFRAVIFANTPDVSEAAISKLVDFVRIGGGLWLALGDRTHPDTFNTTFFHAGGGLSPLPIVGAKGDLIRREDFVSIHPPESDHPATVMLSDTQRLDIDRVKVFQRFPFAGAPAKVNVPVLLQSNTGEPLAIEGFLGRGRIIVQALPMGVRWSNLPLAQAYVPMVHEWMWYLLQPTAISRNLHPGEPLQASLPQNEHVREVQMKFPNRNLVTLATFTKGDQLFAQTRETQLPGPYEVIVKFDGKNDLVLPYQVARPAEESNLDPWPQELTDRWNSSAALRLNPSVALAMPSEIGVQANGEPLWTTLLLLVMLAFFAELWLVRRVARKRFGAQIDPTLRRPIGAAVFGGNPGVRGIT